MKTPTMGKIAMLVASLFFVSACSNKLDGVSENKIKTAKRFYSAMSDGMGDKAFEMLYKSTYDENWRFTVRSDAGFIEKLQKKYGVIDKSRWYVEYDTVHPFYKVIYIVAPIYEGSDNTYSFKKLNLKIGFDVTGIYLPDTIIADYSLDMVYD